MGTSVIKNLFMVMPGKTGETGRPHFGTRNSYNISFRSERFLLTILIKNPEA
jgi:hypothetical protein